MDAIAWPISRCPQGCSLYPEEDLGSDIDLVTVNHWLAHISTAKFSF